MPSGPEVLCLFPEVTAGVSLNSSNTWLVCPRPPSTPAGHLVFASLVLDHELLEAIKLYFLCLSFPKVPCTGLGNEYLSALSPSVCMSSYCAKSLQS